jgi:hypothetical protein
MAKIFAIVVFVLFSNIVFSQSHLRDTSIRKTNWMEYFKHNADFNVDSTNDFIDTVWGRYFVLSSDTTHEDPMPGGYPGVSDVQYGDLDGDGREEAAMIFYTGGTAGAMSYAVFGKKSNMPFLIQWGEGYKLGCEIKNDTLRIYNPMYMWGWEPNCCPSGWSTFCYRMKNNKLFATDSLTQGDLDAAASSVEHFYSLLSSEDDSTAYELLGKKYQAIHPYKAWAEGYKNTDSLYAEVDTLQKTDSTIHVKIIAYDRSPNGKKTMSRYEGIWKMQWSETGWVLTEPKIKKIKK